MPDGDEKRPSVRVLKMQDREYDPLTSLWDRGFSQSEIRNAFERAVAEMPQYTAGEERRGGGY